METASVEIKQEVIENEDIKQEEAKECPKTSPEEKPKEVHYFQCCICPLREAYDYFGMNPPYTHKYLLMEDAYIIEDPFLPPKTGQFIILGAVCVKCKEAVCKDAECSIYFDGTYCMRCAKIHINLFPLQVQQKINKTIPK